MSRMRKEVDCHGQGIHSQPPSASSPRGSLSSTDMVLGKILLISGAVRHLLILCFTPQW
jgi:hypothetical protein